jgi:uncharacterized protein (DUF433 family)
MKTADEAEALLSRLTRGEKARLLQRVAQDLGDAYPGIDTIDEVCGGEPIIVRTRIPVWLLEHARRLGSSEADLLRSYPALRAEDLANAWAYVRSHRDQISAQIRDHEAA